MSEHASRAWESLFRAQVEVMRRFESDSLIEGVTLKEYDVLYTLRSADHRGIRLNELNRSVLMHQSALSRLVERLEERGLVVRTKDKHDKRGTVIRLTDAGRELQREMGRRHVAQIQHYVGGALSPGELDQLYELTNKLRAAQRSISPFVNTMEEDHS